MKKRSIKIACLVVVFTLLITLSLVIGCKEQASQATTAAATTAAATTVAGETIAKPEGIEYNWQPVELNKWVDTTKYRKDPPYTIGLSTGWMTDSWMEIYKTEIDEEVNMYGDMIKEFIHVDSGSDIPTQIANIEDLIARGVDGIIIDALSPTALVPVVEKAYKAGIVTVLSKNGINTENYTAFVNGDNVQWGAQSAQWLVDQLGGKGVILALRGVSGYGVDIERWAGADSVFSKYPDITIYSDYGQWSYDKAKEVSKALIAAHPKFDGIWTMGGQMDHGFIDTLVEAGLNPADYYNGSEDENGYCKLALKYGIKTFVSSFPVWQGRLCVRDIMDALRGVPIIKTTMLPCPGFGPDEIAKLTKQNLSDKSWLSSTLSEEQLNELLK